MPRHREQSTIFVSPRAHDIHYAVNTSALTTSLVLTWLITSNDLRLYTFSLHSWRIISTEAGHATAPISRSTDNVIVFSDLRPCRCKLSYWGSKPVIEVILGWLHGVTILWSSVMELFLGLETQQSLYCVLYTPRRRDRINPYANPAKDFRKVLLQIRVGFNPMKTTAASNSWKSDSVVCDAKHPMS